ncbi:MAG: putative protein-disulfide isomerase [Salibacteraceae bacterium]|jgi:putative protein-disulfide isomerase
MNKLIYVMDPLCGWCYGNSENILAIKNEFSDKFEFEILMGGMRISPNTQTGGPELSQFMKEHGPPMEQTTGVQLSDAFYALANNPEYVFNSLEPCAASVLVKQLQPTVAFEFASAVQKRFYQEGTKLDQLSTYQPILKELGMDTEKFKWLWMTPENLKATQEEFTRASTLATGFPTFLIEINGEIGKINAGYFQLEAMQNHLKQFVG